MFFRSNHAIQLGIFALGTVFRLTHVGTELTTKTHSREYTFLIRFLIPILIAVSDFDSFCVLILSDLLDRQRVCGGAAAIEELIDATDCSFWEFIVIYRKLIAKQMLRRDTATGLVSLGASATARTCPDPAMVAQARWSAAGNHSTPSKLQSDYFNHHAFSLDNKN